MSRRLDRTNAEWITPSEHEGFTCEHATIEVLMDIREELRTLNHLLHCPRFVGIPSTLATIARKLPEKPTARKGKR